MDGFSYQQNQATNVAFTTSPARGKDVYDSFIKEGQ